MLCHTHTYTNKTKHTPNNWRQKTAISRFQSACFNLLFVSLGHIRSVRDRNWSCFTIKTASTISKMLSLSLTHTHQTINGKRLQYLGCSSLLVQGVGQRCPEVGQRRGLRRAHLQRWGLLCWCRPWPETIRPWAEVSLPTEPVPDLNDPLPIPTFLARNYLIRDRPSMTQVPALNWLLPIPSQKWFDCRLTFHDASSPPSTDSSPLPASLLEMIRLQTDLPWHRFLPSTDPSPHPPS